MYTKIPLSASVFGKKVLTPEVIELPFTKARLLKQLPSSIPFTLANEILLPTICISCELVPNCLTPIWPPLYHFIIY
jgi:hypothetical protein